MMEHMWIVGDPQECADRIRQLYETVGGFGMLLAITQDSTMWSGTIARCSF